MSRADELAAIESGMLAMRGLGSVPVTADKVLASHETGVVLADATSAAVTITLPAATSAMDVLVRRVDNGGNRLKVQAAGTDKIKFHTHLNPAGYGFFVLMGAGDFWHLRSDGNGAWHPLARLDWTGLGRPQFESTLATPPGGYGMITGSLLNRADWPWLWDHAQVSGMLTTEAERAGMEGGWTSGDGSTTFRIPEARAEFLCIFDEGRGIDAGRQAGSWQASQNKSHTHGFNAAINGGSTYNLSAGGSFNLSAALTTEASGGGEARPRNIAFPGRFKVI